MKELLKIMRDETTSNMELSVDGTPLEVMEGIATVIVDMSIQTGTKIESLLGTLKFIISIIDETQEGV